MGGLLVAQEKQKELALDEVIGRVGRMTQSLLEEGAEPSQVAFALTSVAADMGLQVAGDPLKVFPVLLNAIAGAAKNRLRIKTESCGLELTDQEPTDGATIH
jgi:hypothetical protein